MSEWVMRNTERLLRRVRPSAAPLSAPEIGAVLGWYARKGLIPLLRGAVRRFTFGHPQGPCFVGGRVSIMYPRLLRVGAWSSIGAGTSINAYSIQGVRIGRQVTIRENSWIQCSSSPQNPGEGLVIGDRTYIGPSAIIGGGDIHIGEDCQIGASVVIIAENHETDRNGSGSMTSVSRKGIVIGAGAWLGHRVTIVDGVVLGERSVVGAGAVVTRSFPPDSRVVGVPARQIEQRSAP